MNRNPAWMIAFILVIQIASFSFEEAPTIIEFDEPSYEDTSSAYGRNNSSGGNNSGGNNTGGNNTGGNNTGGNNTGGNNNSNCGNDSNLTDLMVWTDATTYTVGDSVLGNFFVNCTVIGETYQLDYEVVENNTNIGHADGEWNWTAQNNWESFNPTWTGLPVGDYCIHSTLVIWTGSAYSFVDFVSSCFDIMNSTTGGNNTGGNNTGGNTTSCMSSMQIVDGSVNITGVNSVYNVGDQFNGYFDTCWVPSNNSMSLIAWLNSSNGINHDIQVYSGGNYWASNLGIQQLGPYGHWSFPISEHGSIGILDLYSSLNLPADDYCWEALLEVYDGNTFAPVDDDTACFTIQSNNTGGNNTGCPGLAPSGIDGVIDIVNVSTAYAQGDLVDAWVDLCWSPYLGNTSIWYTVWLNNSNGNTIQNWGLQGSTWFPTWEQGIDYGGGHWEFPLRHLPLLGAWNLSIDALTPGETYCFEGNLKVFDTSIGVFIWVDDATPMCFSTPQSNNTGGNNTGGNNTGNNTGGNNTTANTAPQISSVVISPSSPLETDVLTCSYVFTDADNDPDESIFVWTINGATVTSVNSVLTTGYVAGDFVTCAVLAYDGMDYGNMGTSTVLINSNATGSSNNSSGGGLPSIGIAGTLATIGLSFIAVTRRGRKD